MRLIVPILLLSIVCITSCNNADQEASTIETEVVEVDSTRQLNKDTIIFPDTMASGVGF